MKRRRPDSIDAYLSLGNAACRWTPVVGVSEVQAGVDQESNRAAVHPDTVSIEASCLAIRTRPTEQPALSHLPALFLQ